MAAANSGWRPAARLPGNTNSGPYDHRVADRYGTDVLANDPHNSRRVRSVERCAEIGMVVEDPQSGFVGAVVRIEGPRVE